MTAVSAICPDPQPESSRPVAAAVPASSRAARRGPLIERVTSVLLVTIPTRLFPGAVAIPAQTGIQGSWG
ncbi:hypothetical protein GCM10010429_07810 [Micromonospora olivasterospora]